MANEVTVWTFKASKTLRSLIGMDNVLNNGTQREARIIQNEAYKNGVKVITSEVVKAYFPLTQK